MHRTEIRVIFGDVDAMNVVYYANYLKFFERGRAEFMRNLGHPYAELTEHGLHLPVTEASLKYRSSARYDDLVEIQTSLSWLKKASMRFDYRIVRQKNDKETELVTGFTTHACVDLSGRVRPLPASTLEIMRQAL
jgi:acyl-CoA thioester hydrolase